MKGTEQIDALRVMATNPVGYLVVPRMIACMVMVPLLTVFGDVIGVLGGWLIAGALAEIVERTRAFRVPAAETWRRLTCLPRGAWGMTLAHLGLGLFTLDAVFETAWKIEAAEALSWGLIDRIVAPETLPETVTALTADARGARPAHVGAIKAMIG